MPLRLWPRLLLNHGSEFDNLISFVEFFLSYDRFKKIYSLFCSSRLLIPGGSSVIALFIRCASRAFLVQSLNSPFFPPHIGAEPGQAKEESRITCMRMLRTPPFFPPKSGEKPYLEVLSRFGLWRDFLNENIQATISAFRLIKNMSINPRSVEFHQCHAKPHSICFF